MIANINKEYTSPNSAKARKQREKLNAQIQAYLNGGGAIEEIPSYECAEYTPKLFDQTSNKTRQELAAARKRGKKKMRNGAMA